MMARRPLLAFLVSVLISYSVLNQVQAATTSSGTIVSLLFSATILTIVFLAIAMATGAYLLFNSMGPKRAVTSAGETGAPPAVQVNTHSEGWSILSFLISFLWFKINATPVFPLGFLGGLVIAFWSSDIDRALGKQPLLQWSIILAVIGMIIGLIIR